MSLTTSQAALCSGVTSTILCPSLALFIIFLPHPSVMFDPRVAGAWDARSDVVDRLGASTSLPIGQQAQCCVRDLLTVVQELAAILVKHLRAPRHPVLVDGHDLGNGPRASHLCGELGSKLCLLHGSCKPIALDTLKRIKQLLVHLHERFKTLGAKLKELIATCRPDAFCLCHGVHTPG